MVSEVRSAGSASAPPWSWRAAVQSALLSRGAKPVLFLAGLLPLAGLLWAIAHNAAGPNPAERLIRGTGDWSLRWLCLTLAVTPVRVWAGMPALVRFRRMLGLFAFFYVCVHFLSYAWLDKAWDVAAILKDVAKRPFILVGASALVLLAPLAATSFNRAIKALGARRWQALHRAVYLIILLALLHFYWMRAGKHDFAQVKIYAIVIGMLLGWRALRRWSPPHRA